jgi:hypothetical protein
MSTFAAEQTYRTAVATAEAVRQNSKSAAFTTYGFIQANYAAYLTALIAADVAYQTAVVAAANTAAVDPDLGDTLVPTNWAKIGGL